MLGKDLVFSRNLELLRQGQWPIGHPYKVSRSRAVLSGTLKVALAFTCLVELTTRVPSSL
eukprot:4247182-Pyramimonas_sp.AAC.1